MKKTILFFWVFVFVGVKAQDAKRMFIADMDSMRQYAAATQAMSAELVVVNEGVKNFIPEIKATMHRNGDLTYYKVLHLEYLFGKEKSIIVNHRNKTITYSAKDVKTKDILPTLPSIDSMVTTYDSIVYVGEVNGSRKYYVYNSKYYISKIELYYNPTIHFVSKLIYHYNENVIGEDAVVTVEYRNVNMQPVFNSDEFLESRFITIKGKQYVPAQALAGYIIYEANTNMAKF